MVYHTSVPVDLNSLQTLLTSADRKILLTRGQKKTKLNHKWSCSLTMFVVMHYKLKHNAFFQLCSNVTCYCTKFSNYITVTVMHNSYLHYKCFLLFACQRDRKKKKSNKHAFFFLSLHFSYSQMISVCVWKRKHAVYIFLGAEICKRAK